MDIYSCTAPVVSQVCYVTDLFHRVVMTCFIFRPADNSMYYLHTHKLSLLLLLSVWFFITAVSLYIF